MNFMANAAMVAPTAIGVVALFMVGLGIYWLFNKQAKLRHIAELRKKLDEMKPTDPEYGAVRALHTSMVIDAQRWGFFKADDASSAHDGSAYIRVVVAETAIDDLSSLHQHVVATIYLNPTDTFPSTPKSTAQKSPD